MGTVVLQDGFVGNATLVLLPGLDGTGDLFAGFIAALGETPVRVICYPADRPMDYAQHEALVRAKLPADADYVLLAESFSGPIGIAIAASRSPRLKGLILCASFASNPLPLFSPFSRLITALPAIRVPPALAAPWLYAGRATPELHRTHAAALARVSPRVLATRAAAILSVDQRARLAQIDVPMLYLRAARDRLVSKASARAVLEARPGTQLAEFEAPHFLLQTEPVACAAVTREFLQHCTA